MIVTSMKESEVIKEIASDFQNVFRYSDFKDKKFRRLVIKSATFPVYASAEYISPNKNRWIILFEARNKSMTGDRSLVTYVVTFNTKHGTYAVLISFIEQTPIFVFFAPHFFSRYAQRMHISKTSIELIKHFFTLNANFIFDKEHGVKGSTAEGISLGFVTENKNILFKTFVSFELLKGEQIEDYIEQNNLRKEIHEQRLSDDLNIIK